MLSKVNFAGIKADPRSAVAFGRDKKQKQPSTPPETPSATGQDKIPKPSWGRRNVAKFMLCIAGVAGFFGIPKLYEGANDWGNEQVAVAEARETPANDREKLLDRAAHVQTNAVARTVTGYYKIIFQVECLFLALVLFRSSFKRNMDVDALWETLHNQGLKGQDRKVGLIVQEGVLPGGFLKEEKLNVFEPNNKQKTPEEQREGQGLLQDPLAFFLDPVVPRDRLGKDTALASIISKGNPESTLNVFLTMPDDIVNEMVSRLYEVIRRTDMDMLAKTRYFYEPLIKSISDSVKDSVDKGNDVVVVAQSLDSANHLEVLKLVIAKFMAVQAPVVPKLLHMERPYRPAPAEMKELLKFFAFLNGKLMQIPIETAREGGLGDLLKPWEQAVEYARQKNVPVLIPAGDSGNHFDERPYVVGNMNLLGLVKNEALIPVSSANEQGRISASSSEWNELYQPFIAANGTGELNSDNKIKREWFDRIRLPLGGLHFKLENLNPVGTRYACADLANVILFMKQIDPDLSVQDVRTVLKDTAQRSDPNPVIVEHPKIWSSQLAHGIQTVLIRRLQQLDAMDPVSMKTFIDTFEGRLGDTLGDPERASYIARLVDKVYVEMLSGAQKPEGVLKRLASRPEKPAEAWRISDVRFTQQQMEALPAEERQTALDVLQTLAQEFLITQRPTHREHNDQIASRKAQGIVDRMAAVREVERRKKAEGPMPEA